jgi:chromosome segregation ATPase
VTTVGRARGCDLVLEASDVSTIHCVVFRTSDGYHVRDCNSRTGTRINGNGLRGSPLLRDGDILHVGPFSFELQIAGGQPDAYPPEASQVLHWQDSRRRLAEHAVRLRRQLRELTHAPITAREIELQQETARLREKVRTCDRRLVDLEGADKELDGEREALRARVQDVEKELAGRLEEAEQQVRAHWQEFQQRCQKEQALLFSQVEQRVAADRGTDGVPASDYAGEPPAPRVESDASLIRDKILEEREQQLAQETEALRRERQEFDRMKNQLENGQAEAHATVDKQRAALAQQEASVKAQRTELARMMGELRQLQEELRRPHKAELQALADENERLRQALTDLTTRLTEPSGAAAPTQELEDARAETELLREVLDERERQLAELQEQLAGAATAEPVGAAADAELEPLRAENDLLKQLLADKDEVLEELRLKAVPKTAKSASELERYEEELNEFRRQLEGDRGKLLTEIEQLRSRNQELDEATRELEMEMSRERAELGRERIRMERMRDELKTDMDKMQREMSVRESLAPVQRLRDEMAQKKPNTANPADRARSLRGNQDTPRG